MTIGTLISYMSSCPPEIEVLVYDGQTGKPCKIEFVTNNRDLYDDYQLEPVEFIISIAIPPQ